jgi:hypothetical protein
MLQVAFTGYGEQFRRQRKLTHHAFGVHEIPVYHPIRAVIENTSGGASPTLLVLQIYLTLVLHFFALDMRAASPCLW